MQKYCPKLYRLWEGLVDQKAKFPKPAISEKYIFEFIRSFHLIDQDLTHREVRVAFMLAQDENFPALALQYPEFLEFLAYLGMCISVCTCVRVCVCACLGVWVWVRVRVRLYVSMHFYTTVHFVSCLCELLNVFLYRSIHIIYICACTCV